MEDKKYVVANYKKIERYDDIKFFPQVFYQTPETKVLFAYFKEGQFIPVHTPAVDVVIYVIEGRGEVIADKERINVGPGDCVVVPRNIARGIKAKTAMTILHVVTPCPTEKDHQEVHSKIKEGKFE